MIKKITLAVIILFSTYTSASAQFAINIVNAHDPTYEGETVSYKVIYTNLPSRHELLATVVNGVIIAQNLEPSPVQGSITVKWNCKDINGSITVSETGTNVSTTLNINILSFINDPNYCSTVIPVKQNLTYGQSPAILNVTYCSPSCNANDITYFYQWQVGDVPICTFPQVPANWSNIPNQIGASMLPPVYNSDCIKAYRRITTFTHEGINYTKYSTIAVISTFDFLSPGTLSGGITFNNGVPVITQTPAAGGLCDGCNYMYNWQLSTDNFNWSNIGQGNNYPLGVQIPGNCYIRRSVNCAGEILFSNTLTINPPPLLPGSIFGGGTYSLNTIPSVTQTPASGSACTPSDYIYTWERSINGGAWVAFGNIGVNYPTNGAIVGTCKIRRRVHCVYEYSYSNVLTFTMLPYTSPNAENLNYVRANDIVIPGVHSWEQADALLTGDKLQTTTYIDGFGRGIQSVVKQGSLMQSAAGLDPNILGNYQDIVNHMQFDGLGRADKGFLPYTTTTNLGFFKPNAAAEQQSFNNQKYGEPVNSIYTYSQTTYDGSPLNRVTNVKLPGAAWNNDPNYKGISSDYDFNKQTENVRIWDIGFNADDKPTSAGVYADNLLAKSITKDEKDKQIITYTDLSGNTILKRVQESNAAPNPPLGDGVGWLCTYYVYDDFGRMRYTITPKAVEELKLPVNNWIIDNGIKAGLCFYQEYDKRGRITVKHSPDGGEVWLVYDNRDRLVLSQDENQRNRTNLTPAKLNQWSYSLYDENDRILTTGLIDDGRNRSDMQLMVEQLSRTPQNKEVEIYTGAFWETITAYNPVAGKIPGTSNYHCQSCTASFTNSVSYYDDYSRRPITQKSVNLTSNDFAPTTNQYIEQPVVSLSRIRGAATVSKIRILDDKYDNGIITDQRFLTATTYFDEKGRTVQSYSDNIQGGVDAAAVLYDFAGQVLSTRGKHSMPTNIFDNLFVVTKSEYDLLGRPKSLWKLYTKNSADISNYPAKYKKLSEVKLDEFGRAKTKTIGDDPSSPGLPLETLDYSYNIQGWLSGINKDYAISDGTGVMSNQWDRHFGMYLGYENADGKFTDKQYNGSITGVIWRSQGDNTPRKYNYEYDNINRFKAANFSQRETVSSTTWASDKVNLSASVTYKDANGNIGTMQQMGIVPGTVGGVLIDNLQYQYFDKSNKLKGVNDLAFSGSPTQNGKQGDFKNFVPSSLDYDYDFNGNLKNDRNKNIISTTGDGIVSNFLDLPHTITIKDKSKTEYTYDAAGSKLAKKVTQLTPGASAPVITWYIGGFVYEEATVTPVPPAPPLTKTELQYILNEEGKLRIIEPVDAWSGPSNQVNYLQIQGNIELINSGSTHKWGVWDYFIKDNLSNTRMVLTEEKHLQQMRCTMEDADAIIQAEEENTFGNTPNNEVINTRSNTQPAWANNSTVKAAKLINLGNTSIGPNAIFKVMAGDKIDGSVKYFYQAGGTAQGPPIVNNIVNSLLAALGASPNTTSGVKDNINPGNPASATGNVNDFINNHQQPVSPNSGKPRAFLNYIFFDEQFKYVGESSGAKMVEDIVSGTSREGTLVIPFDHKATKNGYVYIYLSNETQNIPVYFDDLNIVHTRGPIVEDNAYYPYGLKIQGISAKAALKPKTKQGYQGNYNEQDDETGYNEFALRFYDPQIGRWIQVDPKIIQPGMYNGMGDDPINQVDPDGGGNTPYDWGRIKSDDGETWNYKWFANEVAEGWQNVGKEPGTIKTISGRTATLHDGGVIIWGRNTPEISLDDQMRNYVNVSGDVKVGMGIGLMKGAWDFVKSIGVMASYQVAPHLKYIPNSSLGQAQRDMENGIDQLVFQTAIRGDLNIGATMLGNYIGTAFNDYANGDLYDATTRTGKIGFDFLSLYGGEASLFGKAGVGSKGLNPSKLIRTETGITWTKSTQNVAAIMNSAKTQGILRPVDVFVHNGKSYIINGHHRVQAALRLGQNVPVNYLSSPGNYSNIFHLQDATYKASLSPFKVDGRLLNSLIK